MAYTSSLPAPSLALLYKWATVSTLPALLANLVLESKRDQALGNPCAIQGLSTDIMVDCIFPFLCVEEIICLRRVNKLFFILTHEPIVWQRILVGLSLPAPPLSTKYRPGFKLPGNEAEQIVTRAITVDDRFRDSNTQVSTCFDIEIQEGILEMKLLLGGKYLVASVARRRNRGTNYALAVMNVEAHMGDIETTVSLSEDLDSRAYCLDAKYMRLDGEDGIMIVHLGRIWSPNPAAMPGQPQGISPKDMPCIDLDEVTYDAYSGEKYPQEYDCICTFVSIADLEKNMKPNARIRVGAHNIFRTIHKYHSTLRIYDPALFEMNSAPYVSFTEQPRYTSTSQPPDRMVILGIGSRVPSACLIGERIPDHNDWMHRIRQLRVLPDQGQILLVRSIYLGSESKNYLEIYDVPPSGRLTSAHAIERIELGKPRLMRNFHVSDFYAPPTYTIQKNHDSYPPISIFVVTKTPQTILHYLLWPTKVDEMINNVPVTRWKYTLADSITLQTVRKAEWEMNMRVVPGVFRALIWGHHVQDRKEHPETLTFHRYVCRENGPAARADWQERLVDESFLSRGRKPVPKANLYAAIGNVNVNTFPEIFEKGVSHISWDESIGRACVLCGESNRVTILDIAKTEGMDHDRFARKWQR